jgi:hypothetical protein
MITQGEDVEIHALKKQGWSVSAIARHTGRDRKTVRAYLNGDRVAGVRAKPDGEVDPFDLVEPYVRQRLSDDPHLRATVLFREVQNREPHRVDRRCRPDPGNRLRRAGLRHRHVGPAPENQAQTHRRSRQELRHRRLRRRRPRSRVHAPCRVEPDEPSLGDRWPHHPPRLQSRVAADPQTRRGTIRLDRDHRRWTQAPIHRTRPQPGLVQDRSRGLRPDQDLLPRRRWGLNPGWRAPARLSAPIATGTDAARGDHNKLIKTPPKPAPSPRPPNSSFFAPC